VSIRANAVQSSLSSSVLILRKATKLVWSQHGVTSAAVYIAQYYLYGNYFLYSCS